MDRADEVLVALRRVIRAIDLHSKQLAQRHGLTGPQALILKEVIAQGEVPVGSLARRINLSHATVTDISQRLEKRGLLSRVRSDRDRRQVLVSASESAKSLMQGPVTLLQEQFIRRFEGLADWEQTQLISSLQRISAMMDADEIDASPILAIDPPAAPSTDEAQDFTIADESSGESKV